MSTEDNWNDVEVSAEDKIEIEIEQDVAEEVVQNRS